jgi:putative oxidoreductase
MNKLRGPKPPVRFYDPALLVLRVWFGSMLLVKHGLDKMVNFSRMSSHFPDPLHVGSTASLLLALLAEVICPLLVIFGFATRLAAAIIVIDMAVAFSMVHHFRLFGQGSGELALLYLGPFLVLLMAGAGRLSVDGYRG